MRDYIRRYIERDTQHSAGDVFSKFDHTSRIGLTVLCGFFMSSPNGNCGNSRITRGEPSGLDLVYSRLGASQGSKGATPLARLKQPFVKIGLSMGINRGGELKITEETSAIPYGKTLLLSWVGGGMFLA